MAGTKKQNPIRFRGARADASIATIIRTIEENFKLPEGSVRIYLPSGRRAHSDGTVANLVARWDEA